MKNSFTLIEILVYILVLSIVSGALVTATLRLVEFYNITRFNREVLINAHSGLDNILSEIRYSSDIYTPTSSANQISLETNLNPPSGETKTYVDFYLDNGRLCIKREEQDPQPLTSEKVEVNNLSFNYLSSLADPSSIKIEMTVRYRSLKEKYQREVKLSSTGTLRGY